VSVASNRRFLVAVAAGALLAAPAPARAADAEVSAPAAAATLRREWVGLELTPVSYATSQPPLDGRPGRSFSALQGGPGANIRLFRYRGQYAYAIPVVVGLYVSNGGRTIAAHAMGEGGVIVPGTDRRLELGVGVGLGILAMSYSSGCDGSCIIGGTGMMASLAARFLLVNGPKLTAGVGARMIMPLAEPHGEGFGHYTRHSSVVMGALEVAFGRP
jgi:hypothetical protein